MWSHIQSVLWRVFLWTLRKKGYFHPSCPQFFVSLLLEHTVNSFCVQNPDLHIQHSIPHDLIHSQPSLEQSPARQSLVSCPPELAASSSSEIFPPGSAILDLGASFSAPASSLWPSLKCLPLLDILAPGKQGLRRPWGQDIKQRQAFELWTRVGHLLPWVDSIWLVEKEACLRIRSGRNRKQICFQVTFRSHNSQTKAQGTGLFCILSQRMPRALSEGLHFSASLSHRSRGLL